MSDNRTYSLSLICLEGSSTTYTRDAIYMNAKVTTIYALMMYGELAFGLGLSGLSLMYCRDGLGVRFRNIATIAIYMESHVRATRECRSYGEIVNGIGVYGLSSLYGSILENSYWFVAT